MSLHQNRIMSRVLFLKGLKSKKKKAVIQIKKNINQLKLFRDNINLSVQELDEILD